MNNFGAWNFLCSGYGKPGIFHAGNAVFADSTPNRSTSATPGSLRVRRAGADSIFVPHTPACAALADLPRGDRGATGGVERTAADKKTAQRKCSVIDSRAASCDPPRHDRP